MKKKTLIMIAVIIGLGIGAVVLTRESSDHKVSPSHSTTAHQPVAPETQSVPAHYTEPPSLSSLAATLPPEQFVGKTKEAYDVARAIPQTLAQLPCYCHCDRGMGHKSLHSCFEDDHAAHCAVCVDEALLAYRLQKEDKLSAEQVRQKIVEKYSVE
jgi:hypothetical protein